MIARSTLADVGIGSIVGTRGAILTRSQVSTHVEIIRTIHSTVAPVTGTGVGATFSTDAAASVLAERIAAPHDVWKRRGLSCEQ